MKYSQRLVSGCLRLGEEGWGNGRWLLMGMPFLSRGMKMFWYSLWLMTAQLHEYTENIELGELHGIGIKSQ